MFVISCISITQTIDFFTWKDELLHKNRSSLLNSKLINLEHYEEIIKSSKIVNFLSIKIKMKKILSIFQRVGILKVLLAEIRTFFNIREFCRILFVLTYIKNAFFFVKEASICVTYYFYIWILLPFFNGTNF